MRKAAQDRDRHRHRDRHRDRDRDEDENESVCFARMTLRVTFFVCARGKKILKERGTEKRKKRKIKQKKEKEKERRKKKKRDRAGIGFLSSYLESSKQDEHFVC